jgi:hypothetical protein
MRCSHNKTAQSHHGDDNVERIFSCIPNYLYLIDYLLIIAHIFHTKILSTHKKSRENHAKIHISFIFHSENQNSPVTTSSHSHASVYPADTPDFFGASSHNY